MDRRTFSLEDQRRFADLSGDANPVHVDPIAARRLLFGGPVVHGMHTVFWLLDAWLKDVSRPIVLERCKAQFRQHVAIGDEVIARQEGRSDASIRLLAESATGVAASLRIEWTASDTKMRQFEYAKPVAEPCRVLDFEQAIHASGEVALGYDRAQLASLLARIERFVPAHQVATLLAATRIVGMRCPGFHSLFAGFELRFEASEPATQLRYRVARHDPRFRALELELEGMGMSGRLDALHRPAPAQQAQAVAISSRLPRDSFAGQRALVIGGSRGLGEVAAKLLALGGAEVRLTYHSGHPDALRVVEEIRSAGASAACFRLDVLDASHGIMAGLADGWRPNALHYFATPHIRGGGQVFSPELFRRFCDHYVTGFAMLIDALRALGSPLERVLYPSSVYVDEPPPELAEYAAAKAAGEVLCAGLERSGAVRIVQRPRLPRLATDQTISLLGDAAPDPVPVLLAVLRALWTTP